ncbi:MAG: DUF4123 domain-containing protein [Acidobacteria bacterium]|nr:DUF4123 domain-containing protein [Acidobacteriota bacterium]
MQGFLEIINGRYAGTTEIVPEGDVCTVGATFGADLFLPNDSLCAPVHFVVKNETDYFLLEKAGGEVFVNNQPFEKGQLAHGDWILAGKTLLRVSTDGGGSTGETVLGRLVGYLINVKKLALLIDESTDSRISPLLNEHGAVFRELKKDVKDLETLTSNPLLVIFRDNGELIETLVRSFWGKGRLVFFQGSKTLAETVKYLQFLLAKTRMSTAADLRFYDPRVLRAVLSGAEPRHAQYFFGAAKRYFVESQIPGHLFEFNWTDKKASATQIRLCESVPKTPTAREIHGFLGSGSGDLRADVGECVAHFSPEIAPVADDQLHATLPIIDRYRFKSLAAKIQAVVITALFGAEIWNRPEIKAYLQTEQLSNDDKLDIWAAKINRSRF